MKHPRLIEIIRNQAEQPILPDVIEDNNNNKSWVPERKSDYLDIRLIEGQNITKIEVVEGSNCQNFYLELVDIQNDRNKIKVALSCPLFKRKYDSLIVFF